jgi:pimeloyl-ACP methyl ester carboxylesterase
MIKHSTVSINGAEIHVARAGRGRPLLLLHGWPEFWLTWEPVMTRLADRFDLIAPDLRGFGSSDKPTGPFGPNEQTEDLVALVKVLGVARRLARYRRVDRAVLRPQASRADCRAVLF